MKLTEWVAKGLYLTLFVICVLDGLLKLRCLKITGGIHDCAPADHVLRQTFNSTCLILLGTGVPPCSIIMSSQKQKSQRTQSESEAWQCEGCQKTFVDKNSKLLLCEYCDNAYCIECLQLSVTAYNVFKKTASTGFVHIVKIRLWKILEMTGK